MKNKMLLLLIALLGVFTLSVSHSRGFEPVMYYSCDFPDRPPITGYVSVFNDSSARSECRAIGGSYFSVPTLE